MSQDTTAKISDIAVLVVSHKQSYVPKSTILRPIQVGTANARIKLEGVAYHDNTGDNISDKNPHYSELTALYWAWKNLKSDYVGLFHYRRYLSFLENQPNFKGKTVKVKKNIAFSIKPELINDEVMRTVIEANDFIVPKKEKSSYSGYSSAYEHYKQEHFIEDLDFCLNYLNVHFPEIAKSSHTLHSSDTYAYNMFIMKRDLFDSYCNFLFSTLEAFDKQVDYTKYDTYQGRVDGFIAERLTSIFIEYLIATKRYKYEELTPLYFENTSNLQFLSILPARVARKILKLLKK